LRPDGVRVVVDTNTLISGLISRGSPPARVLKRWAEGAITVLVTSDLAAEYQEVLARPAFAALGTEDERLELLGGLLSLGNVEPVTATERLDVVQRDPDDNRVLECALFGGASVIITGDEDLLALGRFRGVAIVSPKEFLERFESPSVG
jgi:putative PIN family toxin of toxin-antitoxin system